VLERLTQKVGPLPVWAYGVILGGIVGIYVFWIRGRGIARGSSDEEVDEATEGVPDLNATPGIIMSSPYGRYPMPGAAGGALDVNELYSINPDTGRPYIVDLNDPINPTTGLPYKADYASSLTREELLQKILDEQRAQLEELRSRQYRDPEPIPLPTVTDPSGPAPPRATPTPQRQYLPTLGPWNVKPNAATIASLQQRGYKIVRRGDGKWIAVDKSYGA
jgi:hypothetical protein